MVPLIGLIIWFLALTALTRVLWSTLSPHALRTRDVILWGLLGLLAAGLLFRPNEEIFGGQDPGAYLNSAASFARHKTLFHIDPLLAEVPQNARTGFFYGHSGFGLTKDACLWVRDAATALIGPWFQPAYSIMMSPVAVVRPFAILYVAPFLGLMTGLVLACLARRLIARPWAAALAFLFYLLAPVVIWNARCPRPELGASFFLLAGWALLLNAWERPRWQGWHDLALGAICVGVAPFFHVTAWHPVLATFILLTVLAMTGRDDFLLVIPLAVLSVAGFVAQSYWITDCYHVWRFVEPVLARGWALGGVGLAGLGLAITLSVWNRRRAQDHPARTDTKAGHWLSLSVALISPLAILAIYAFRNSLGQLPFLSQATTSYLTLTDFRGVVRLTSPLAAIAAMAGWMGLALRQDAIGPRRSRNLFMLAMLPGLLLTGWMDDYMMETRRILIVPAPLMALSLAALVAGLAALPGRLARPAAVAACVLLLGSMAWDKTQLYTRTEYRGLHRFMALYADDIQQHNGILLAEYSQAAAPFEHYWGIPTLSIDSDRQTNYRQQEKIWLAIMKAHPEKACFFMSPNPDPLSETFDFALVRQGVFEGVRLPAARGMVPNQVRPGRLPLYLYRLSAKDPICRNGPVEFVRRFDGGNMGLRRFGSRVSKPQQARGTALPLNVDRQISWTPGDVTRPEKDLYVFISARTNTPTPPRVVFGNNPTNVQWTPLVDGWWCAQVSRLPATTLSLSLRAEEPGLMLVNIIERSDKVCRPVSMVFPSRTETVSLPAFNARWARDRATLLLPAPSGIAVNLFVLMRLSFDQPAGPQAVSLNDEPAVPADLTPGVWEWRILPLPQELRSNNVARLTFTSARPGAAELTGDRDDLVVMVGAAVMRPEPKAPPCGQAETQ